MTTALAIFCLLMACDGWTTWHVLRYGGYERNKRIAAAIKKYGKLKALLFFKVAPVVIIPPCLWVMEYLGFSEQAFWLIVVFDVGYAAVVINNYLALRRQQQENGK